MLPDSLSAVHAAALISLGMLVLALLLTFARLWRGPDLADRVVALDLVAVLVIGIIAAHAVLTGDAMFLNAAGVTALIVFLGTVAFARYLEKGKKG
ncbi:MAG: pH regulation protein F [Ignavibacteria bacterium]|nr:MAG: pH regulation protein F [Ignavibacteria bacterium]